LIDRNGSPTRENSLRPGEISLGDFSDSSKFLVHKRSGVSSTSLMKSHSMSPSKR
jgi:hypothetical protein